MFTGLVEGMGRIVGIQAEPAGARFTVDAGAMAEGALLGDSICLSGCCLTVVAVQGSLLEFQAGKETLSKTTLGHWGQGDSVNLERSLKAGDRLGGHFVTGHVDDVGSVTERRDDHEWSTFHFEAPQRLMAEIAPKGSIAVNGVSLTVVDVQGNSFSVALIPHTLAVTNLGGLVEGSLVNLETDVLAKYVRRAVFAGRGEN